MGYAWNHDGVERAIEDTMRDYPELLQRFEVAHRRDPQDFTWHVDLDPQGERRRSRHRRSHAAIPAARHRQLSRFQESRARACAVRDAHLEPHR